MIEIGSDIYTKDGHFQRNVAIPIDAGKRPTEKDLAKMCVHDEEPGSWGQQGFPPDGDASLRGDTGWDCHKNTVPAQCCSLTRLRSAMAMRRKLGAFDARAAAPSWSGRL